MFDMHFHSNLSDWKNSPEEIIQEAKKRKLKLITLTDHDIISSKDFIEKSSLAWIKSLYSTEISARDNSQNKSLHLTCYSNWFSKEIYDILENTVNKKTLVIFEQVKKLAEKWFKISYNEMLEYYKLKWKKIDTLNRFDIAMYLLKNPENKKIIEQITWIKNMGLINFFEEFLKESWIYYKEYWLKYWVEVLDYEPDIEICSDIAKINNALISIAHPNLTYWKKWLTALDFYKTFEKLYEKGINAIEINSMAEKEWIDVIYDLKRKFWIIITAWSDNHFIWHKDNKHWNFWELNQNLTEIQKKEILEEFMKYFKIS